jgi:rRNA maturation RNase YbeY
MIYFFNNDVIFPFQGKKRFAKEQIRSLIDMEDKQAGDLCFIFCTDAFLLDMNKKHLNHDYYTDVMAFDYTIDNVVSGDIFISVERIDENAREFGVSFNHELNRVMYHGMLHLCGYKDKSEDEKQTMREKENFYLTHLLILE